MSAGALLLGLLIIYVGWKLFQGGSGRAGLVAALAVGASVAIVGTLASQGLDLAEVAAQMVARLGGG